MQDNISATGLDQAALQWLTGHVIPTLRAAGVKHWAWVCSPTLASYQLAEIVVRQLPQLAVTIFHDLEHAATWVQSQLPALQVSPPRLLPQRAGWTVTEHLLLPGFLSAGYWIRYVA